MNSPDAQAVEQRAVMKAKSIFTAAEDFPKPLIAMINGFCLGGGCELALSCDLRIASDRARFRPARINLGIIPGGGGTQRLTRLIGEGKAMQLILTGELIDAQEAHRLRLVNEVYPHAELREKTLELANKIAEKSPVALAMAKAAVKNAARTTCAKGWTPRLIFSRFVFSAKTRKKECARSWKSANRILRAAENEQNCSSLPTPCRSNAMLAHHPAPPITKH
jgi:enoyl-CoA hydratase